MCSLPFHRRWPSHPLPTLTASYAGPSAPPREPVGLTVLQRNAAGHLTETADGTGNAPIELRQLFHLTVVPAQLLA